LATDRQLKRVEKNQSKIFCCQTFHFILDDLIK
jgi:hypothetical protein